MQHATGADAARLREIYGADTAQGMAQDEVDEVLAILERAGARTEALDQARHYRDMALADLNGLPMPEEHRAGLQALLESVIAV
jgi:geranylgeranyl pyrophosphate synthase